ncbi:recombinase family protein [Streptomyces nojiriensis]|uniref:recombinase family protein n=1 Tax=Streptomyces nojiriensis TaxID=66374 RepID=UPI0035DF75CB
MDQVRLLGALRESKGRDWSDSFEGQENDVHGLVARHRGVLVETTRDRDVSGREVRLFDRPELGPWLKKPDMYDGIAVQKIDRLTREAGRSGESCAGYLLTKVSSPAIQYCTHAYTWA